MTKTEELKHLKEILETLGIEIEKQVDVILQLGKDIAANRIDYEQSGLNPVSKHILNTQHADLMLDYDHLKEKTNRAIRKHKELTEKVNSLIAIHED